jgi:hypothetical protein
MRRMTRASARAVALSPDVLPLHVDACPIPSRPARRADGEPGRQRVPL